MPVCFDSVNNRYEYCTSYLSTYIAVGVVIPLGILTVIALVYIYFRCKQGRSRRAQQQIYMGTIIPIYNSDEQQVSYNYPPHYASMSQDVFEKPPPYEQTVQQISETNNSVEHPPAILPVTTTAASSSTPVVSKRNEH